MLDRQTEVNSVGLFVVNKYNEIRWHLCIRQMIYRCFLII